MSTLKTKVCNFDVESGDDIVISGMSGRYPKSNNVAEFASNLYNKVDMIDDRETRWRHTNPEIPRRSGKINNIGKFDSAFFGIGSKQVDSMDPQVRMLMEHSHEAVLDAGLNPKELWGSNTAVVVGASSAESEIFWLHGTTSKDGSGMTGSARTMLANRISFALRLNGPSVTVDTACSSSLYALDFAYKLVSSGDCDAAIVGASNLNLSPSSTLQFARLGVLSMEGICRSFDDAASGYVRSEAITVFLLQKRSVARRVYATLVHSKTNCDGYKENGISFPSSQIQAQLIQSFYKEIELSPNTPRLGYIEAHITSTKVGDPEECKALDQIFCTGRDGPILVGSVKSNMGHAEPASGFCSLTKVLIAFENQKIPPNLHFVKPKSGIPSLVEGRLKVVVESTDLPGDLICVNSFGFGGANAHALLRANPKAKINKGIPNDDIPRLVVWSGRNDEACNLVLESVTNRPLDAEYVALLQHSQLDSVPANLYRGYGVFTQSGNVNNATCALQDVQHFNGIKRPVVWLYSGMGSQWDGMGRDLMKIPIFCAAIEKCHKVLAPHGLDLKDIITSLNATTFDNILNSFVGIAAVQIGLTDVLKALGIQPDHIIGHSVGELGCAYADGCMTTEEMILSAYSRGMASNESKVISGSMAAIGLGFEELSKILPKNVEIACHNSSESCTISGLADSIAKFVEELKLQNIFAKEVACSNIPYHSSFIAKMGPVLLAKLKKVIKTRTKRSSKWISSSFSAARSNEEQSQFSSPEYHTNNLLSPVLFEEASALLPKNAMIIEIAPHGLLQAIVKRSFPDAINIPMTQRSHRNNDQFLFGAIGKIYAAGFDLNVPMLYPALKFPVSRGTPMISPLIKWDHSQDHFVVKFGTEDGCSERKVSVSLSDPNFEFISGHVIDGRCLFPATGYLFLVWETLALTKRLLYSNVSVEFEDVKFVRATSLAEGINVEFIINIFPGTGRFEISEKASTVVTGLIRQAASLKPNKLPVKTTSSCVLPKRGFYKEMRLRGYQYKSLFKSVVEANSEGLCGKIQWNNNWVAFLDCMMQFQILKKDSRSLMLPTSIRKITIDPIKQLEQLETLDNNSNSHELEVRLCPDLKLIQSGGVEMTGMKGSFIGRRRPKGDPVLEVYKFVPYIIVAPISSAEAMRIIVQLALENSPTKLVKAVEVKAEFPKKSLLPEFHAALEDLPLVSSNLVLLTDEACTDYQIHFEHVALSSHSDCFMVISSNCLNDFEFLKSSKSCLTNDGYIVCRESNEISTESIDLPEGFTLISTITIDDETLCVLRFDKNQNDNKSTAVVVSENDLQFEWIDKVKTALKNGPTVLVAENEPLSGILGIVNCLRREPNGTSVSCVMIDDARAPKFSLDDPFYRKQLQLGLAINIFKDGTWGSYRHLQAQRTLPQLPNQSHCYVNALIKSDLSSLKWISGPYNYSRPKGELVKVKYAALNFRDVMLATGKISGEIFAETRLDLECVLGMEYSGLTSSGKRVMGMTPSAALSTYVESDAGFTFDCPSEWTLEQAATVPVVYITVYAAFFITTRIQKGKSVLIHAGSGGIGLAAIRVAFAYGLEVFTTVSTEEKKKFLLKEFPQLKEQNIGNSRDTSFENMVLTQTKGKGVDYVLNSLAEEKLLASVRCLGKGGKFLEIGKFDMANDTKIGLRSFMNELSFHAVMVDRMFKASSDDKKALAELLQRDIKAGIIKPLKTNVFNADQVEQAFRLLASGKHVGKVLLKIRENEMDAATLPIAVVPRIYCNSEHSYIICGGLGGFGLELADWLVLRGCRKLVLSSSRGITKQYQSYRIKIWETYGVQVTVNTSDISTKAGCEKLICDSMKLGLVGGIFNLAVILKDGIFDNQDAEKFTECMAPKATATKHLDDLSRVLCPELQYFVVFSSVSCGRGNAGQSNYGMANSVMEKIMEQRSSLGLPAKAIQWGAVGEVGLVADLAEDMLDMEIGGTLQQRISSCLEVLDSLLTSHYPVLGSMVVAEKRVGAGAGLSIIESVMNIMSIRDIKSVSMDATLSEIGMDSLMAVEIRQMLEREYELFLSPQDLRSLTFMKLQELTLANEAAASESIKIKFATDDVPVGVELMLRNLGDEKTSEETILRLTSQDNSTKHTSCVILIPGIEGVAGNAWRNVANSLALPAYMLQLMSTQSMTTIQEISQAVSKDICNVFSKDKENFYIVGYSFGAMVALELAQMLEKKGLKGQLVLIDGAPIFLKKLVFDQMPPTHSDDAVQSVLINGIMRTIYPEEKVDVMQIMTNYPTWEGRLEKLLDMSMDQYLYTTEYLRKMANCLFQRIKMVIDYKTSPGKMLKSSITLVRPTEISIVDVEDDYGIHKLTSGITNIKYVEGNHLTMLENAKLIQIINDLDPALESNRSFKKHNLI